MRSTEITPHRLEAPAPLPPRIAGVACCLGGFITDADLPSAECEWPGLQAFFFGLAVSDRPRTFLDLVWRFENRRICSGDGRADSAAA